MRRAHHLIWKIVRFLLIGTCGCILFCIIAYGLIYVTSLKKYPQTYVISDVALQRVIIDGDSLFSGKKLYLMKTSLKEGTRTEIHPGIYYDGLPPFPDGSEDSVLNIYIETKHGTQLNDMFETTTCDSMKYGNADLYGLDTLLYVFCDHDIRAQEKFLTNDGVLYFRPLKTYSLFSLNETDSFPHKIRFVFPDRVIEKTVNNTPKYYTVKY